MNRSLPVVASLIALFAALSAPALAKDDNKPSANKPFAVVNGRAIPQARADALLAGQMAQGQPDTPKLHDAVREELVRREVLVQEAEKKGMDKKIEIQAQMMMARQGVLIGAYLQDYVKAHPVSDEAIKKEYEGIRAALGDKEYKARHILVEKEDEAKAIIEKLAKGEKFEELAKQSKDPGSKERGGDLGWANQAAYVKPFSDAMIKLAKGKHTEAPVKSDFGWHVILLEDTRELKAPPLDGVKPQIAQRIQQQMVEKHIIELRGKAKVE
ncbi:MAG: peptidylprolyl isomerase [Candidatus Nitricoxidivorans perseverans]|uniref:peptidylprolyl isomerase n=1 Tax=Candidatus Nitricoxidivorans perseverans TaxID=2975601 RepID=A0AA49IZ22_9PROT|nr:MAG: peptidylprolyl isomerase [Candidatus Nitricoxidivorans perseverans]